MENKESLGLRNNQIDLVPNQPVSTTFAMKNSDCLAAPIVVMKFTGVWLPDNLTYRGKVAYMVFRWGMQILLLFFIILAEIGYVYEFRHDTHRILDAAVMLLAQLLQAVKVMAIIIRQEKIKRLITLGDGPDFTPTDPKLKVSLARAVKLAGIVSHLMLWSASITAVFWIVVPALQEVLTPPLKIAFAVIYAYCSLSVLTYGAGVAAENFLVSGVLWLASAQVGLLNDMLLDLKTDGNDDCYKKAVWCIKFHQRIIEYVEEIAKIFGLTIFCQCFTSSVVVCMTVYKISITPEPIELVTMIFYLVCMMLELLMYCYPADLLLHKSLQVSDSAYPEWTGDVKTARVLLLIAVRAQRPLVVNAGGMIRISLPTAAAVVQTSYTYYALLRQQMNE